MNQSYEEILGGVSFVRRAPGPRHELICERLHKQIQVAVSRLSTTRLLPPRAPLQLSASLKICPDLALITEATGKLWLAAEIVNPEDHRIDTVDKKQVYEDLKLPRLWMIDPRYDNIEVYHATPYGMSLKGILAGHELLTEKLLSDLELRVGDLFPQPGASR
jgi:Uma2 family endonuclease